MWKSKYWCWFLCSYEVLQRCQNVGMKLKSPSLSSCSALLNHATLETFKTSWAVLSASVSRGGCWYPPRRVTFLGLRRARHVECTAECDIGSVCGDKWLLRDIIRSTIHPGCPNGCQQMQGSFNRQGLPASPSRPWQTPLALRL